MELLRVVVNVTLTMRGRMNEVIEQLTALDFIPIMMDIAKGQITGYCPDENLDLMGTIDGVVSIDVEKTIMV